MKIEAESKSSGLNGGSEVWVHVFSNTVHDWPSIEAGMDEWQRELLADLGPRKLSYFPHHPDADERDEHGYRWEEWFVWQSRLSA